MSSKSPKNLKPLPPKNQSPSPHKLLKDMKPLPQKKLSSSPSKSSSPPKFTKQQLEDMKYTKILDISKINNYDIFKIITNTGNKKYIYRNKKKQYAFLLEKTKISDVTLNTTTFKYKYLLIGRDNSSIIIPETLYIDELYGANI